MSILALMPDSYGGQGGIAQYYRDLFDALSGVPYLDGIVSLPRHAPKDIIKLPKRITERPLPNSPIRYSAAAIIQALKQRPNVILCGHINLISLAATLKRLTGARLALQVHGVEAWHPGGKARLWAINQTDCVLAVSRYTRERVLSWSGLKPYKVRVIPNTIRMGFYQAGGKPPYLVNRYKAEGKRVLLTLGRLSSKDRYKGHDRIIAVLPELIKRIPNLLYIVAGEGDDCSRLEKLVETYGMQGYVLFTGNIRSDEKTDHYQLADAFAMPSTGEGFGIAFLEAAACGLPVLGGSKDGSRDALLDGELGVMVDPTDPKQLLDGLQEILQRRKQVPEQLKSFGFSHFREQVDRVFSIMLNTKPSR
ncbi:MAG: glycosyltransferase family 4 protein [Acidobacteriota bacterium]